MADDDAGDVEAAEDTVDLGKPTDDDAPADSEDDGRAEGPGRRRALDGRTLAICALVAVIAALLAGFVTSRVTADDGDEPAGEGTLVLAEDAPDLVLPRLGGGDDVRISDYRGQPVVVNFWASWCLACVEEMPDFQRVHESLGDQVAFLGINVNEAEEAGLAMVARTGVTYDLARDDGGELVRALEVTNFPSTFLIDEDGTIVDVARRQVSAERLCEKINQSLLNQSLEECG
jgi:peroxiredoxin